LPKPHPFDDVSRENLTWLLEGLDSLSKLVWEISGTPFTHAAAAARLRITILKSRLHRMINALPDDMPTGDQIPAPAEGLAHLAAAPGRPQPWLSPTVLETPMGLPEVIGPAAFVPEAATSGVEETPISLEEFQRRGATEALRAHLFSIAAEEFGRLSRRPTP
jgi:hypothetical protein